jgi:hypothetical protein
MERNIVQGPTGFKAHRGAKALQIFGWTNLGVAFAVVFALVSGFVVKILWNWLMPAIFGVGTITYWQAFGIVVLAKLLFGAFGYGYKEPSNHFHRRFNGWREDYKAGRQDDPMMEGWKYYKQYWKEKGKAAFDDYIRRMEGKKAKEGED